MFLQVPFPHGCRSHSLMSVRAKPPTPAQPSQGNEQLRDQGAGKKLVLFVAPILLMGKLRHRKVNMSFFQGLK